VLYPQGTGAAPPPAAAPPPPPAVIPYDPGTGDYVGPDGKRYTQSDLAHPQSKTWQQMLIPPAG
jgi:phospholipid/cholesterol/gamma-HCH transport system substrate-binding protein